MKGIGFLGLILLAILVLLVCWCIYLQLGIRDTGIKRKIARETLIIEDINKMEFLKRSQKPSLKFSFYGAYDFLGKRGGYFDLSNIQSYDCVPYWQVYDTKNLPDFKGNMSKTTSIIFNDYMDVFTEEGFTIPYYEIDIESVSFPFPDTINVETDVQDYLVFKLKKIRIADKTDFSIQVLSAFSQEFEIANENLIKTDSIEKTVEDGINSAATEDEIENKIHEKIRELEQDIQSSAGPNFDVKIEIVQIEVEKTSLSAAAIVEVTIENKDAKYLIGNELKSIPLKFRIIDGNLDVIPPTNICTETEPLMVI